MKPKKRSTGFILTTLCAFALLLAASGLSAFSFAQYLTSQATLTSAHRLPRRLLLGGDRYARCCSHEHTCGSPSETPSVTPGETPTATPGTTTNTPGTYVGQIPNPNDASAPPGSRSTQMGKRLWRLLRMVQKNIPRPTRIGTEAPARE